MEIPAQWTFKDDGVAREFDSHVREQLPWYDLATMAVAHVAKHYITRDGLVYDIGASTGNIGIAIADTLTARSASLIAIEPSREMIANYRGPGQVVESDAESYNYRPFDLAILFLTLMFIAPHRRAALIERLRSLCRPGGAIIVFDKLVPAGGYRATVFTRLALAAKVQAGVDAGEVMAKELSLAGVQRPIYEAELGEDAYPWLRFGDFGGWIIERRP